MSVLEELVSVLGKNEAKGFVQFLRTRQRRSDRLDERLFQILYDGDNLLPDEIAVRLYDKPNLNAYHTLRKRLLRKLYLYLHSRRIDEGLDHRNEVGLVISAASILIENDRADTAAKILNKAKNLAMKAEHFEGGLDIIRFEIEHADVLGLNYVEIVEQWREWNELVAVTQRVDIAYSVLRMKLRQVRVTGKLGSLDAMVRHELDRLGIDLDQDLPVSVVYKMMNIIRMAIIATKEYHQFEPLITQTYQHLVAAERVGQNDVLHHLGFCYMIAHTKFRTRKLAEANVWVERMKLFYAQSNRPEVRAYVARYYLLKASIMNFDGDNEKAISTLEYALTRPELLTAERMNVRLNLTVCYFQINQFKLAHQTLNHLDIGDKKCEQILGKEWLFKKILIEMIILIELDYQELILTRMRSVKRMYQSFLNEPLNEWMELFVNALQLMLSDPESLSNEKVAARLDEMVSRWPVNREDLHAMTFRCWLLSKVQRRPYYEVLIESLKPQPTLN